MEVSQEEDEEDVVVVVVILEAEAGDADAAAGAAVVVVPALVAREASLASEVVDPVDDELEDRFRSFFPFFAAITR